MAQASLNDEKNRLSKISLDCSCKGVIKCYSPFNCVSICPPVGVVGLPSVRYISGWEALQGLFTAYRCQAAGPSKTFFKIWNYAKILSLSRLEQMNGICLAFVSIQYIWPRNQTYTVPLHLLQAWQVRFLYCMEIYLISGQCSNIQNIFGTVQQYSEFFGTVQQYSEYFRDSAAIFRIFSGQCSSVFACEKHVASL